MEYIKEHLIYVVNVLFNFCLGVTLVLAVLIIHTFIPLPKTNWETYLPGLIGSTAIGILLGFLGYTLIYWWKKLSDLLWMNFILHMIAIILILSIYTTHTGIHNYLSIMLSFGIVNVIATMWLSWMVVAFKPWA